VSAAIDQEDNQEYNDPASRGLSIAIFFSLGHSLIAGYLGILIFLHGDKSYLAHPSFSLTFLR